MQANYADTWREPGFYELFGDRGRTLSKPGLVPERVFRRDAGFRMSYTDGNSPAGGFIEFVQFGNTCRNLIQWYSNNYGFNEPVNVGGAYVKGYELVWRGDWYGHASLSGNLTFQESEVTATRKVYHLEKELPNRPGQYGGMTLDVPLAAHALFWSVDYKDSYYLDRANQLHRRYPGRTLHDLGVRASIGPESLSCTLVAKNITNEQTFDIQGMPKPGRSYMLTVTYQLR
jgi:outer membrane receptor protein involved in Fe transport